MEVPGCSIGEIGQRFTAAFRLSAKPLAVYGSDGVPDHAVHLSSVNRCIAVAMYRMAAEKDVPAIYLGRDAGEGCCPGGLTHMGFTDRPEYIRHFVSTGRKDVRGRAAEYLKATPELVDRCFAAVGSITPPGNYLVIQACEAVPETHHDVRSVCCFGNAEQIRNIAALVHFDRDEPFFPVLIPWGPACATFVSYPAGFTENAPANSAFAGPQDPTFNWAFPPDYLGIGIPFHLAQQMAENIERSFIAKRPRVAFPDRT